MGFGVSCFAPAPSLSPSPAPSPLMFSLTCTCTCASVLSERTSNLCTLRYPPQRTVAQDKRSAKHRTTNSIPWPAHNDCFRHHTRPNARTALSDAFDICTRERGTAFVAMPHASNARFVGCRPAPGILTHPIRLRSRRYRTRPAPVRVDAAPPLWLCRMHGTRASSDVALRRVF